MTGMMGRNECVVTYLEMVTLSSFIFCHRGGVEILLCKALKNMR
jgi:hypothetical protein